MSKDSDRFDQYQRAREKREAALEAYRKAESEFIAADRELANAKRDWYGSLLNSCSFSAERE